MCVQNVCVCNEKGMCAVNIFRGACKPRKTVQPTQTARQRVRAQVKRAVARSGYVVRANQNTTLLPDIQIERRVCATRAAPQTEIIIGGILSQEEGGLSFLGNS